jgi:predicted transcriptional regulator
MSEETESLLALTADIVTAHVANNSVAVSDLPVLIANVHTALAALGGATAQTTVAEKAEPAVSIRASVKPDVLTCLCCGKTMTMLKRHVMTDHGMTPDAYRAHWGLPKTYPMVAPNYAERRRALAISIGLGRKAGSKVAKRK